MVLLITNWPYCSYYKTSALFEDNIYLSQLRTSYCISPFIPYLNRTTWAFLSSTSIHISYCLQSIQSLIMDLLTMLLLWKVFNWIRKKLLRYWRRPLVSYDMLCTMFFEPSWLSGYVVRHVSTRHCVQTSMSSFMEWPWTSHSWLSCLEWFIRTVLNTSLVSMLDEKGCRYRRL